MPEETSSRQISVLTLDKSGTDYFNSGQREVIRTKKNGKRKKERKSEAELGISSSCLFVWTFSPTDELYKLLYFTKIIDSR